MRLRFTRYIANFSSLIVIEKHNMFIYGFIVIFIYLFTIMVWLSSLYLSFCRLPVNESVISNVGKSRGDI